MKFLRFETPLAGWLDLHGSPTLAPSRLTSTATLDPALIIYTVSGRRSLRVTVRKNGA